MSYFQTKKAAIIIFSVMLLYQAATFASKVVLANITKTQSFVEITSPDTLVQMFYSVIDRTKLDKKFVFNSNSNLPLKCGTQILLELGRNWDKLPSEFKSNYRHYFIPGYQQHDANTYTSSGGHFTINWGTSLADSNDSDGDGIPNVVELWAEYFETTYAKEVTEMGFQGPMSTYPIYIANTGGSYTLADNIYGITSTAGYIVVRENYNTGFPANNDPEGSNKGAMKVTAAHEFHHAIQFIIDTNPTTSDAWWMEATSTWMEDAVFNLVNDYINYLGSWSVYPYTSLTLFNNSHEYGDVIWSKYLSETYATASDTDGSDAFLSIWKNVAALGPLGAISHYLQSKNTELKSTFQNFALKNLKMDYIEGSTYGTMAIAKTESAFPVTTGIVTKLPDYLGCNYIRFSLGQAVPTFNLKFDGEDSYNGNNIEWKASILKSNGTTETAQALTLDGFNQGSLTLFNLNSSDTLTLIASVVSPTNIGTYQVAYSSYPNGVPYSYSIHFEESTPPSPLAIHTATNYPNPITESTTFYIEASRTIEAEIKVFDQRGRLVKTLNSPSGTIIRVLWDGRDNNSQALANGVYFYLVKATDSEGNTISKKGKCAILWKN